MLHFAYDASNKNTLVGIFTPVNESVWEHLKLSVIPISIFGALLFFKNNGLKNTNNKSFLISFIASILSMFLIILFNLIANVLNITSSVYHIANYIISMAISFKVMYMLDTSNYLDKIKISTLANILGLGLTIILIILFGIFTFSPPKISLMKDPVTQTYGIEK